MTFMHIAISVCMCTSSSGLALVPAPTNSHEGPTYGNNTFTHQFESSVDIYDFDGYVLPARQHGEHYDCQPATVFNVGLPRTGTTSISTYLADLGFTSYHIISPSFQDVQSCYQMDGACDFYGKLGASDPTTRVGFEDVPTFGLACALAKAYPTSKFILMIRPPDAYSASVHFMLCKWVRPHCGNLETSDHLKIQTLLYGEAFPNFCNQLQRQPELCEDHGQSLVAKHTWEVTGLMKQFADVQTHHDEQVVQCVPKESILSMELGALTNNDRIFKFMGCNGVAPPFPDVNAEPRR